MTGSVGEQFITNQQDTTEVGGEEVCVWCVVCCVLLLVVLLLLVVVCCWLFCDETSKTVHTRPDRRLGATQSHCRKAQSLADRVVIITNADDGWVETSCGAWMPALLPALDDCEVISARSSFEPLGVTSPAGWKERAFSDAINRFYSRYRQRLHVTPSRWWSEVPSLPRCSPVAVLRFLTRDVSSG